MAVDVWVRWLSVWTWLANMWPSAKKDNSRSETPRPLWTVWRFSSRTVKVDEKLCIRIEDHTSLWDGALHVGFTNICPQRNSLPPASIPELKDTRGYCVVPVPEDLCRRGVQLQFWINYAGKVIVQEIGGEKYYLKAEGLNLNNPLWVFIDLYGSTNAVRLLSKCEKITHFSC